MNQQPLILDGKKLAQTVARTLLHTVNQWSGKIGRAPGLAVILVGEDPASKTYVASKHRFAKECGVKTLDATLPAQISGPELAEIIQSYNRQDDVDGILLQLPLPKPLDGAHFTRLIAPEKDADGLHPLNQGLLLQGLPAPRACTPVGVMTLIDLAISGKELTSSTSLSDIPRASLAGMKATVIGRSQLVGKPSGILLLERNATVTFAHSKTKDLAAVCRESDIIVAAVGVEQLVKRDWVKPGAIVIDVGTNRASSGKLVGDVDFEHVAPLCRAITPVPGGVGPMTVAMLMSNTVENYLRRNVQKETVQL
jgi:methylenetetrahydrofolate dehydrogenase (NADP+)/methenyltetrahydrofolate cyclohydrolase